MLLFSVSTSLASVLGFISSCFIVMHWNCEHFIWCFCCYAWLSLYCFILFQTLYYITGCCSIWDPRYQKFLPFLSDPHCRFVSLIIFNSCLVDLNLGKNANQYLFVVKGTCATEYTWTSEDSLLEKSSDLVAHIFTYWAVLSALSLGNFLGRKLNIFWKDLCFLLPRCRGPGLFLALFYILLFNENSCFLVFCPSWEFTFLCVSQNCKIINKYKLPHLGKIGNTIMSHLP